MAQQRRRIKHTATFEERLAEEATSTQRGGRTHPPGCTARELLLRRRAAGRKDGLHERLATVRESNRRSKLGAGDKMSGYYAYFTGDDGHITSRVTILAANDEEAKERAKQLVDGHPVELWQEGRKIATFDPEQGMMLP